MQHIGIQLENETGVLLSRSDINFAKVIAFLWESDKLKSYPWLSGIDSYGNTTINLQQAPFFLKELQELQKEVGGGEVAEIIKQSVEWLNKVEQHTYLKFVGD
jgi:hypothetical protein